VSCGETEDKIVKKRKSLFTKDLSSYYDIVCYAQRSKMLFFYILFTITLDKTNLSQFVAKKDKNGSHKKACLMSIKLFAIPLLFLAEKIQLSIQRFINNLTFHHLQIEGNELMSK